MPYRLYLDTSVLGALTDPGPAERVVASGELMHLIQEGKYEGLISTIVLEEIAKAPPGIRTIIDAAMDRLKLETLVVTPRSKSLSDAYMRAGIFPSRYQDDARHIALATVAEVDAIVSWNFRHMVNVVKRRQVNGINLVEGYSTIEIVSPLEVAYEAD